MHYRYEAEMLTATGHLAVQATSTEAGMITATWTDSAGSRTALYVDRQQFEDQLRQLAPVRVLRLVGQLRQIA